MKSVKEYFINSNGKGRVFISQPMKGKTSDEIRFEREDIVNQLTNKGYVVADSILQDTPPEDNNAGLWCLGESIKILSGCDYAYFVDGWKLSGFSDDDFYDVSHMNIQGSAKFSAILNDFIEQLENN